MPPAIRRAALTDIPAICTIEQQAPSAAHWPAEEYAKLVATGLVLVAEQESDVCCGFVCAKAVAGEWELENIVVAPAFHRRGIADFLLQSLFDEAKRADAVRVFLEVRESNLPARRLYEKHKFRESGRRHNYYQNPSEDAIVYERRLN